MWLGRVVRGGEDMREARLAERTKMQVPTSSILDCLFYINMKTLCS